MERIPTTEVLLDPNTDPTSKRTWRKMVKEEAPQIVATMSGRVLYHESARYLVILLFGSRHPCKGILRCCINIPVRTSTKSIT